MLIVDFIEKFNALYPEIDKYEVLNPLDIENLEENLGDKLPLSFITFLKEFSNGIFLLDCVPTASAAIMMYYDSNGYPNLSSSNDWKNVADRLGVLMAHNNSSGVLSTKIKPGLDSYISEKGYSNFTVTRDTSVSISDIKSEIYSTSPALLRVLGYDYNSPDGSGGGHVVTLVGYETYTETSDMSVSQYALEQDNWKSTGQTVYLLMGQFGSMTNLLKIRD